MQHHVMHFMIKCKCGNIVSQCRCPYPDKAVEEVETCFKCQKIVQVLTGAANMELHRPAECTPEQARFDLAVLLQYIAPGIPEVDEIRERWSPSR
jgi:hypothetical protein